MKLTIFYLNDLHGNYLVLPEVFEIVTKARSEGDVLLFDTGDTFSDSYNGLLQIELMNLLGFTAWLPGNHDLSDYFPSFKNAVAYGNFCKIASNITTEKSAVFLNSELQKSLSVDIGNFKIQIQGLTEEVTENHFSNFFISPENAVKQLSESLSKPHDFTILLSHLGFERDKKIAASNSGPDLIIGGHSHTILFSPMQLNNSLICQAGGHGQYLGKITFFTNKTGKWNHEGELIQLSNSKKFNNKAQKMIERFHNNPDGELPIAILDNSLSGAKFSENPVGSLVTDAINAHGKSEVAFFHAAAISPIMYSGHIYEADINRILSWDNPIFTTVVSGKILKQIVNRSLEDKYLFLHVSGFRILKNNGKLLLVQNQTEIMDKQLIRIAVPAFLTTGGQFGGKGFPMLRHLDFNLEIASTRSCVIEYLRKEKISDSIFVQRWAPQLLENRSDLTKVKPDNLSIKKLL